MKTRKRNSTLHRVRQKGFRARMKTRGGRAVIRRRRAKGCKRLAPTRQE